MSSDTDSCTDSSSSTSEEEEETKYRKSSKKRKHKSDKKKHTKKKKDKKKKKKTSKIHEQEEFEQNEIKTNPIEDDGFLFGPALPPHLLQKQQQTKVAEETKIIGPTIPKEFLEDKSEDQSVKKTSTIEGEVEEEEYIGYGPVPASSELTVAQIELEQRALELKMAAIDGKNLQAVDTKVREEWMLELPKVGLTGGLAALTTMKRTFYQGKERPDFSDRSDWTKTPQDAIDSKSSREKSAKAAAEAQEREAMATFIRKRDEEQERLAKSHKKKHKMDESLVELHRKKLRKEQKKKEKELAKSGLEPERRPFSRDVDLKLNKIDSHQTKKIVDKAKILHSKFASGHAKYL